MAKQKFPYDAFTLSASMIVRPIKIVRQHNYMTSWHVCERNHSHHTSTLYATHELAIKAGKAIIASQEARIKKSQENLAKRKANLKKAEGK